MSGSTKTRISPVRGDPEGIQPGGTRSACARLEGSVEAVNTSSGTADGLFDTDLLTFRLVCPDSIVKTWRPPKLENTQVAAVQSWQPVQSSVARDMRILIIAGLFA